MIGVTVISHSLSRITPSNTTTQMDNPKLRANVSTASNSFLANNKYTRENPGINKVKINPVIALAQVGVTIQSASSIAPAVITYFTVVCIPFFCGPLFYRFGLYHWLTL